MNLALSKIVNSATVDGYYEGKDAWFTREQIGAALEYEYPVESIGKIHNRHKERLDLFSLASQVDLPVGKREVFLYNLRGVLEICRWSRQPKADMVMDALYDMAMEIIQKGYFSTLPDDRLVALLTKRMDENPHLLKEHQLDERTRRQLSTIAAEEKLRALWDRRSELSETEYQNELGKLCNNLPISRYNQECARYRRWLMSVKKQQARFGMI